MVFFVVTSCSLVDGPNYFAGTCCLHLHGESRIGMRKVTNKKADYREVGGEDTETDAGKQGR
jgi:hypothetical protein